MVLYRLAVVIKKGPSAPPAPTGGSGAGEGEQILVVRQAPPPPLAEQEYRSYVDSDLWDLPSAPLKPLERGEAAGGGLVVEGADSFVEKLDIRRFDVRVAIDQVMSQVALPTVDNGHWACCKLVEEPDFGPDSPVHTLFIKGRLKVKENMQDTWSSGYTRISDGDEICVGDERLRVIFALGHTDGHVALLHVSTNALVVGDHCVGLIDKVDDWDWA